MQRLAEELGKTGRRAVDSFYARGATSQATRDVRDERLEVAGVKSPVEI